MSKDPLKNLLGRLLEINNQQQKVVTSLVSSNAAILEVLLPLLPKDVDIKRLLDTTSELAEEVSILARQMEQAVKDFNNK